MGARRSCVACREEADREQLVRLALDPAGSVVVDYRGRLPGRGVWLHPSKGCAELLTKKPGVLRRSFGTFSLGDVREMLLFHVHHGIEGGLSQAAASGALLGGHDKLAQALRDNKIVEVLVATDASARTIASLRGFASADLVFTPVPFAREVLGQRVGRGARAALGVTRSAAASYLRTQLHRLRMLG